MIITYEQAVYLITNAKNSLWNEWGRKKGDDGRIQEKGRVDLGTATVGFGNRLCKKVYLVHNMQY